MNNIIKISALALAMSFSFMAANADNDVSYAIKQVQKLDLGVNMPNAPYRETEVDVNIDDNVRDRVMMNLIKVREKAWDDNAHITSWLVEKPTPVREYNKDHHNYYMGPGKDSYANEFGYSYELEKMAIQRAFELTLTGPSGYRPDNFSDETFYITSSTRDESIREKFNEGPHMRVVNDFEFTVDEMFENLVFGKDGNPGLYEEYKNSKGSTFNIVMPMLMSQPTFVSVGYGQVHNPKTGKTAAVLLYGYDPIQGDKKDFNGTYKMSYGNPKYEPLPEATEKALKKAIKDAESQIAVVENLQQNFPKTISKVQDKLYKLLNDAKATLEEAYELVPVK